MRVIGLRTFLVLVFVFIPVQIVSASPANNVTNDEAVIHFPDSVTFSATLSSNANIESAVLEYGNK